MTKTQEKYEMQLEDYMEELEHRQCRDDIITALQEQEEELRKEFLNERGFLVQEIVMLRRKLEALNSPQNVVGKPMIPSTKNDSEQSASLEDKPNPSLGNVTPLKLTNTLEKGEVLCPCACHPRTGQTWVCCDNCPKFCEDKKWKR